MLHKKKITGTQAAVISINTSYKKAINANTLVAIFMNKELSSKWQSHLGVFFSELPDSVIHDFMEENKISSEMMMNVYLSLPSILQTKWECIVMNRSKEKALFIAKKNMVGLVYNFQALEGMPFTLPEVQTYLQGITVGGHKVSDQDKLKQQALAWQRLIQLVETNEFVFSKSIACELNKIVAKDESADPGFFRHGTVRITGTDYTPPDHNTLDARFDTLHSKIILINKAFERGVAVSLDMARNQYFFDGNKRTGLLMMNGIFLTDGIMPFSIPAKSVLEYNEKMLRFYETGDEKEMSRFFDVQYSKEYPGIQIGGGMEL